MNAPPDIAWMECERGICSLHRTCRKFACVQFLSFEISGNGPAETVIGKTEPGIFGSNRK